MKVDNGSFRTNRAFVGKVPTHGVYTRQTWQLLGAEATPLSLHHDFDSAMAAATRLEADGAECTLVCFDSIIVHGLRILHLEDDENDHLLVESELGRHWKETEFQRVRSAPLFAKALNDSPIDLVLCDSGGPDFDGKDALALTRIIRPDVPFVILSGASDEKLEALKMFGADGVLSKCQLFRLRDVLKEAFQRRGRTLP